MYFIQRRPDLLSQLLLQPTFAYRLANPEETMKTCASKKSTPVHRPKIHVVNETERFLLYTDLPGVKAEDITVELNNKGVLRVHGERRKTNNSDEERSIKFERQFLVDEKLIDPTKITATLTDGSLEIVVPKNPTTAPRKVAVVAGAPNETDKDNWKVFDVDVPGVKVEALQMEVNSDGRLMITGERKRGGQTAALKRSFSLDVRVVDTTKLDAFLEDGVLTVRVPTKEPFAGRVIPVSTTTRPVEEEGEIATKANEQTAQEGEANEVLAEEEEVAVEAQAPTKATADAAEDDLEETHDVKTEDEETQLADSKSDDKTIESEELEFEVIPETVTQGEE